MVGKKRRYILKGVIKMARWEMIKSTGNITETYIIGIKNLEIVLRYASPELKLLAGDLLPGWHIKA